MTQKTEIENETLNRAGMKVMADIDQYQSCDWIVYDKETDIRLAQSATRFEHLTEAEDDLKDTIEKIINKETNIKIFEDTECFWWALKDKEKIPIMIDCRSDSQTEKQAFKDAEEILSRLMVDYQTSTTT